MWKVAPLFPSNLLLCEFIQNFSILVLWEKVNSHSVLTIFTASVMIWTRLAAASNLSGVEAWSVPSQKYRSATDFCCPLQHWDRFRCQETKIKRTKYLRVLWPPVLMSFIESEILFVCTGAESQSRAHKKTQFVGKLLISCFSGRRE